MIMRGELYRTGKRAVYTKQRGIRTNWNYL